MIEHIKIELMYSAEIRNIVLNVGHCSSLWLVNISCFAMWLFAPMEQSPSTVHQGNQLISVSQFSPNILTSRFPSEQLIYSTLKMKNSSCA